MLLILPALPAIGSAIASAAGPAALTAGSISQGAQAMLPMLLNILKKSSVNVAGPGFNVGVNNRRNSQLGDILEQLRAQRGLGGSAPSAEESLPVRNVGKPISFDSLLRPGKTFVDNRAFSFDRPVSLSLR